jgi:hypothetical protein
LRNGTFGLSGCGEGGLIGFITVMIKKHIHDLEANLAKAAGDPASYNSARDRQPRLGSWLVARRRRAVPAPRA